jgi:hypothetical protein
MFGYHRFPNRMSPQTKAALLAPPIVRRPNARMSALGQKQTSGHVCVMSALPPKADIQQYKCSQSWAVTGYSVPLAMNNDRQAIRAILLASATAATLAKQVNPQFSLPPNLLPNS